MKETVKMENTFNMEFASYMTGSYFGDNDTLLKAQSQRQYCAVCKIDSQLYSITCIVLEEILDRYPSVRKTMLTIAQEKQNYYETIMDDIKKKYRNKTFTKILYDERRDYQWTFYMSIKRERFKKNLANDYALHQLIKSSEKKEQEKQAKMIQK